MTDGSHSKRTSHLASEVRRLFPDATFSDSTCSFARDAAHDTESIITSFD